MNEASNAMTMRRRGRKPVTAESQAQLQKMRDEIAAWHFTPPDRRDPPTLTALAAKLHIPKQTAHYHERKLPDSIEEFIEIAEREALAHYPRVLAVLTAQAEGGNIDATKVYIRQLAEPRRPQAKGFDFQADVRFQALMALGPPPAAIAGATVNVKIESAPALTEPVALPAANGSVVSASTQPPRPSGNGDRAMPARPSEPANIVTGRHDQWCHCRDCRPDLS